MISDPENTYYESGSLTSINILNVFPKFYFGSFLYTHTRI